VKIAIGCDHRGFPHKQRLLADLAAGGHETEDCGCPSVESADYPDAAFAVAERVADGRADLGILICGSGIGMSIAANKMPGVRAALCHDTTAARTTREHNDSNVLCLSGDTVDPDAAAEITTTWLAATFEAGRHARRVDKIVAFEQEHCG